METKLLIVLLFAAVNLTCADDKFRIIFYFEPTTIEDYSVANFTSILEHPGFDRTRDTVIFHYSRGQRLTTHQVHDLIASYATSMQFNFIVLDYADSNDISVTNAPSLSETIASVLIDLLDAGLNEDRLNLIGHGLGAQILARAARRIQIRTFSRYTIAKLTGLDPAIMDPISSIQIGTLSPLDAKWVETVHTEGVQRGDLDSRGQVSFFVNGGVEQPTCNQIIPSSRWECSHMFAMRVWAESVRNGSAIFPSLSCGSWSAFLLGDCNNNAVAFLGRFGSDSSVERGTYFLLTNRNPPLSRSQAQP